MPAMMTSSVSMRIAVGMALCVLTVSAQPGTGAGGMGAGGMGAGGMGAGGNATLCSTDTDCEGEEKCISAPAGGMGGGGGGGGVAPAVMVCRVPRTTPERPTPPARTTVEGQTTRPRPTTCSTDADCEGEEKCVSAPAGGMGGGMGMGSTLKVRICATSHCMDHLPISTSSNFCRGPLKLHLLCVTH